MHKQYVKDYPTIIYFNVSIQVVIKSFCNVINICKKGSKVLDSLVLTLWELNQTESNWAILIKLFQPPTNNSSASREKLVFSVEEVPTANQIEHEPSKTPEGGTESKYCLSKGETSLKLYICINLHHLWNCRMHSDCCRTSWQDGHESRSLWWLLSICLWRICQKGLLKSRIADK